MAKTIAALFDNRADAHGAVQDLVAHGFPREDIGVMTRDEAGSDVDKSTDDGPSGLAQGAGIGAALGGISGLVIGLAALTVPGVGPALAAGPLAAGLLGAGVGAAAGGLIGALVDMGIPAEHAEYYGEGIRRGGVLVTVTAPDERADEAVAILSRHHPIDLTRRAEEWRKEGWKHFEPEAELYRAPAATRMAETTRHTSTGRAMTPETSSSSRVAATAATTPQDKTRQDTTTTIPVVEEEVQVGKRPVERHVRVHTTVEEKPVEKQIPLHEERVIVERRRTDRPARAADQTAFKESTIDMTEKVEEPVVNKEARVVEEVVVHKETQDRVATVRDTERHTEVEVEPVPTARGAAPRSFEAYDADFRKHFTTTFAHQPGATYDIYLPAYRYGYTSATDKRYNNRDWATCTAEVQRDWERDHPGTWERFKDAIRHAWDKVRGRA